MPDRKPEPGFYRPQVNGAGETVVHVPGDQARAAVMACIETWLAAQQRALTEMARILGATFALPPHWVDRMTGQRKSCRLESLARPCRGRQLDRGSDRRQDFPGDRP